MSQPVVLCYVALVEHAMVGFLSLSSLAGGTFAACFAHTFPRAKDRVELVGGLLLVFGFALIGAALAPLYR